MIVRDHRCGASVSRAVYSDCERYRYALTRVWDATAARLHFVMLNPSTATERADDPTVARCGRRARRLGYGGFRVTNVFAWRATCPAGLRTAADPVGPANDAAILAGCDWAGRTICAWGAHGALAARGAAVARLLREAGHGLHHLGLTRAGHPRHPLYIAYARRPAPWPAATPAPLSPRRDSA